MNTDIKSVQVHFVNNGIILTETTKTAVETYVFTTAAELQEYFANFVDTAEATPAVEPEVAAA